MFRAPCLHLIETVGIFAAVEDAIPLGRRPSPTTLSHQCARNQWFQSFWNPVTVGFLCAIFEHSGCDASAGLPVGPTRSNFFFSEFRICGIAVIVLARQRGVSRSSRYAGRGAVDAAASARDVTAGRATPVRRLRSAGRHGAVTAASLASRVSTRQPSEVR